MIEAPRRHGHFDPRWHTNGLSPRDHEDGRPPMIRTPGDADAHVSHDVGRSPRQRHAPLPAFAADDGPSIHRWENEGGSYSMSDELDLEVEGPEKPPAGLEWYAFLSRYFPDRRRHDLEALKAYEAYRSAAVAPSISHRGRTAPRGGLSKMSLAAALVRTRDPQGSPESGQVLPSRWSGALRSRVSLDRNSRSSSPARREPARGTVARYPPKSASLEAPRRTRVQSSFA
jgi:hypothetical protein